MATDYHSRKKLKERFQKCKDDNARLLAVARAAKNRKREGMTFDEIGEAQDEFEAALAAVEDLLV